MSDDHHGAARVVTVTAPARLHLGFIDLHGGLGRRFGSLGLTLDRPRSVVRLRRTGRAHARATGPDAERALAYLQALSAALGLPETVELEVLEAIPLHAGLGSGTQLALAVGSALTALFGRQATPAEIAVRLDRGARSGIGIGAFERGGFLVDGGRGRSTRVPPLLCRLPLPETWRLLLLFDDGSEGVHGEAERDAFASLPPLAEAEAGRLSRLLLMQVLPALAEGEIEAFGHGLSEIQRSVGDHFAPRQGGRRFASASVAAALEVLLAAGAAGGGQSSWGPTGFALYADAERAGRVLPALRERFPQLRPLLCRPRNRPAEITIADADADAELSV